VPESDNVARMVWMYKTNLRLLQLLKKAQRLPWSMWQECFVFCARRPKPWRHHVIGMTSTRYVSTRFTTCLLGLPLCSIQR